MQKTGRIAYRYRQLFQVILLAVVLVIGRPLPTPAAERALLLCALLLVVLGGALRSWAMGYHTWRRVHGEGSERSLVTTGPYAMSRNPLYLGSFMIGCGLAAMSGRLWLLVAFAVVFIASYYFIIRWEEGRLAGQFGKEYGKYMNAVPRLFPGLRSARERRGRFDMKTMLRCMEPVKTLGFVVAVLVIDFLKARGWTPLL
jgi:protein-S-isoprenylcysteine O-methyltransferase Ste14